MKSSEILREAARLVERRDYGCGCDAIAVAAGKKNGMMPPVAIMNWLYFVGPERPPIINTWWGVLENNSYLSESNRNARIIGLCLAAAIAESEGG